jgi:hypothetical protein
MIFTVLIQYFFVILLLLRLPVVSPGLNPVEAAMMEMLRQVELEDSMLSDHEVRHKSVFMLFFVPSGYSYNGTSV